MKGLRKSIWTTSILHLFTNGLRKDLKKYGTDSFEKRILEYTTADKVKERESYHLNLVNARDNPLYYNKTNSSSISKFKSSNKPRPLCKLCGRMPAAVNYRTPTGIVHYRSRCANCIQKKRGLKPSQASWAAKGYKKKPHCEKCGFKAKYREQLFVYYIDGNLSNNDEINLRTVCANCQIAISREGLGWKQGDLVPDY